MTDSTLASDATTTSGTATATAAATTDTSTTPPRAARTAGEQALADRSALLQAVRDEVLLALGAAPDPLAAAALIPRCPSAEDGQQVYKAAYDLRKGGLLDWDAGALAQGWRLYRLTDAGREALAEVLQRLRWTAVPALGTTPATTPAVNVASTPAQPAVDETAGTPPVVQRRGRIRARRVLDAAAAQGGGALPAPALAALARREVQAARRDAQAASEPSAPPPAPAAPATPPSTSSPTRAARAPARDAMGQILLERDLAAADEESWTALHRYASMLGDGLLDSLLRAHGATRSARGSLAAMVGGAE